MTARVESVRSRQLLLSARMLLSFLIAVSAACETNTYTKLLSLGDQEANVRSQLARKTLLLAMQRMMQLSRSVLMDALYEARLPSYRKYQQVFRMLRSTTLSPSATAAWMALWITREACWLVAHSQGQTSKRQVRNRMREDRVSDMCMMAILSIIIRCIFSAISLPLNISKRVRQVSHHYPPRATTSQEDGIMNKTQFFGM